MVECSPATRAARVRFPADATFVFLSENVFSCEYDSPKFPGVGVTTTGNLLLDRNFLCIFTLGTAMAQW